MYLSKSFVENLGFQRIKEKKPGFHPPFILPIKDEFDNNDIHAGSFEMRKNHKNIFLAVLKQGNTIVLQSEKKGQPIKINKFDGNSDSNGKLIQELIKTYVNEID